MMWQTFPLAVHALMRNKTRSLLTTLGIVIGVGAVIAMVAIGEGAKARVEQAFASMGTSLLIVTSGSTRTGGIMGGFGSQPTLTWEDLDAMRKLPSVRAASPLTRVVTQTLSEDQNWNTTVFGVSPEYFDVRDWRASSGRIFSESDLVSSNKTVVLGQTVMEKLFGRYSAPLGSIVRIGNVPFEVAGVLLMIVMVGAAYLARQEE